MTMGRFWYPTTSGGKNGRETTLSAFFGMPGDDFQRVQRGKLFVLPTGEYMRPDFRVGSKGGLGRTARHTSVLHSKPDQLAELSS